jgi:DNA-binding CsgD family transcriptional regulator
VLLVRGALADGDRPTAAALAGQTQRLAMITPGNPDMAAAADHARGLIEQDLAALGRAAESCLAAPTRASALEDAGQAWAGRGEHSQVMVRLSQAHALYQQLGAAYGMVRVRSGLRAAGDRLRHWTLADRPAFDWDSLTGTGRRVADLVAQGLSNLQVGHRVLLSSRTVAFHLRHIFWRLGVTSRAQLARMAAEQGSLIGDRNIPSLGSSRLICASWRGRRP